jgi:hypothetical protein
MDAQTTTRIHRHPNGPFIRPEDSLFVLELDGETFASYEEFQDNLQAWDDYYIYLDESYAESAWLRAAENNPAYSWECEQDELRAQAMGLPY